MQTDTPELMRDTGQLAESLAHVLGAAHVSRDPAELALAAADLFPFPGGASAELVVRPGSTRDAAEAVRIASQAGRCVLARGAGLSYTGGTAASTPAVVVDTTRMDAITVHAQDLYAVVGAGTTWQALADALAPHGLRTLLPGPISGAASTVGGAVSQGMPASMDGVIGLAVILADGTLARTGAGAREGAAPFLRHAGPDLTGLFIGDCGAFGVKAEVVLRLLPQRDAAFASFAYADASLMIADMVRLQREGLVTRAMAMDQGHGGEAGRMEAGEALKVAGAVAASAGSALAAVRDVASMLKGRQDLAAAPWSLHLTAEGASQAIADAQVALARAVCAPHAREIEPTVPRALRARPFSIRGFVGVQGERWVPVHGMLAPSRALGAFADIEALFARHRSALDAAGVRTTCLLSSVGAFVTMEPMFFWMDELDPLHHRHLSARNQERFANRPVNATARELVMRLRAELRELFERHDAVHAQLGRFYRHAQRLDPGSRELLARIKQALDATGQLNPGVLGLEARTGNLG